MPIKFRCKSCQQSLSITRRKAGTIVNCPKCGNTIKVPQLPDDAAQPAPHEPARPESPGVPEPVIQWRDEPVADDDESFGIGRSMEFEEMDLTPMVDVTFLLLIFFMVTASFSLQKTIDIPVPDPDQQGLTASEQMEILLDQSIRVEIDEDNVIRVEDEVVEDRSQIADRIREMSSRDQKNELILVRHPRAFHEFTVTVVDAAHAAGVQKIRVAGSGGGAD